MRDCFLPHRWPWRRLWLTTTHTCGPEWAGSLGGLSFRSRGWVSSEKPLPDCRLQRQERASRRGGCRCFLALVLLQLSLAFSNLLLAWRDSVLVEELASRPVWGK